MVGSIQVGGGAPLVLQSMCTTPTQDVAATIAQSIVLAEAGCQIVRITAPGVKDAQALKPIRAGLSAAGFAHIPIVADIHFMPNAALEAIEHVEKVRINPGNYADKKRFAVKEYTDADYAEELDKVAERFLPLAKRAKELGRALRIGTNHGSLSDRIMNRYGDTPAGMVESAMEFIRIAESVDFRDIIISMKSSNPKVMVEAYRLLVATLRDHGTEYPLHLGVTEAGDGEDGRIKSAAGIGTLLEDGLGDTIRVSLTEPPECEIPVAQHLAGLFANTDLLGTSIQAPTETIDPFSFKRRIAAIVRVGNDHPIGGGQVPAVFAPIRAPAAPAKEPAADAFVADDVLWAGLPHAIAGTEHDATHQSNHATTGNLSLIRLCAGEDAAHIAPGTLVLVRLAGGNPVEDLAHTLASLREDCVVGIADAGVLGELRAYRLLAASIDALFTSAERRHIGSGRRQPIVVALPFLKDDLHIAAIAGSLLIDGIGDALYLPAASNPRRLAFSILQAVKARVTRADYVACPSCGRTQFDLMEVTASIKAVTSHLDGVTIAVMGCIVNGPGEMADADFGYVGSGPGKIDLYRRKSVVRRNLPFAEARDGLIQLIKDEGMWKDPDQA
jgi:(E)-4-hydroxy-3-methylbut-2-enyl-diphosphate synthase